MLIRTKKGTIKEILYDEKQLYNYGINRLSSRDYCRKELYTKMKRLQPEPDKINRVLDKLESQQYLSDINRAKSLFNQFDSRESINKTKNRIIQKGVSKEIIEQIIYDKEDNSTENLEGDTVSEELNNAYELLIKKFHIFDNLKRDKMTRFLASKGYKYTDISKALRNFSENIKE